ncbi:MAG: hypothetical protein IID33_15665, partial [Planctomycetes bacterium]|nr:hypothetical protein [Planctomycetota bacterium]
MAKTNERKRPNTRIVRTVRLAIACLCLVWFGRFAYLRSTTMPPGVVRLAPDETPDDDATADLAGAIARLVVGRADGLDRGAGLGFARVEGRVDVDEVDAGVLHRLEDWQVVALMDGEGRHEDSRLQVTGHRILPQRFELLPQPDHSVVLGFDVALHARLNLARSRHLAA